MNLTTWIEIYPQISTVFFFVLFLFIVYKVIKYEKKTVETWGKMPLNDAIDENKTINI